MRLCHLPFPRACAVGVHGVARGRWAMGWATRAVDVWPLMLVLCMACAWHIPAWAGDRADHDEAREAVARGQVMPLERVLAELARQRPGGQILEVELESKRGRWVYEIKQVEPGGQLVKLKLDAQTGELINDRSPRPVPTAPLAAPQRSP